jgi:hypothetical protein
MEDYVGFCTSSEVSYVPSIDEMEKFCFTSGFCKCMLFKNGLLRAASSKIKGGRLEMRNFSAEGRRCAEREALEAEVEVA